MAKTNRKPAPKAKQANNSRKKETQSTVERITNRVEASSQKPKTLRDFTEAEIRAAAVNNAEYRLEAICESHGIMLETTDNFGDIGKEAGYVDVGLNFGLYAGDDHKQVVRFRGESDGPLLDAAILAVQSVITRFTTLLGTLEGSQPKPLQRGLYVKRDQNRKIVEASLYASSMVPEGLTMTFEPIGGTPQPIPVEKPAVRTEPQGGTMVYAAVIDGVVKTVSDAQKGPSAFCKAFNDLQRAGSPQAEVRLAWVNLKK